MKPEAYSVHRFRKAVLQFIGGRLAQAAARAVLVLVLVRILPIRDYGAYMLIVGTSELLLQVGDTPITVVIHGRTAAQPDEIVHLAVDSAKAHVFDSASGRRLG